MVEIDDVKLLFDPFISGNEAAASIDIAAIKPDYILLSHGHQDHILDAENIAKQSGAPIVSNFEIASWYQGQGIDNAIPMNHGGTVDCRGVKVKMTNAVHTSSFPDGSYAGQPAGFVVKGKNKAFFYSGDTALHTDMQLIGQSECICFAILCIGDHFTMGTKDAIRAAEFVGTNKIVGMHYDTFPPIEIDHEAAIEEFKQNGFSLKLPEIGETFSV